MMKTILKTVGMVAIGVAIGLPILGLLASEEDMGRYDPK